MKDWVLFCGKSQQTYRGSDFVNRKEMPELALGCHQSSFEHRVTHGYLVQREGPPLLVLFVPASRKLHY